MQKLLVVLFVFVFGLCIYAQNAEQKPSLRHYQGEDYVPYIFEPYRADYKFKGNVIGLEFTIFDFSTRIFELQDEWQETLALRFKLPDEPEIKLNINSTIDLKTGLLKKIYIPNEEKGYNEIVFETDKIVVTSNDGKRTASMNFPNQDKIYPCYFSATFMSYLPLDDNFSGSFSCVAEDDSSDKPAFIVQKLTLKVVGSEKISTALGVFDCYKLESDVVDMKLLKDGKIKEIKKKPQKYFDEKKFWKNIYSNTWIDKKTRRIIKGEVDFKGFGSVGMEIQKIDTREL